MSIVRAILNFLYEVFLGCSHQHLTRPFTLKNETYMVCLDCGKQVFYSMETMHTVSARDVRRKHAAVRVMPNAASGPKLVPSRAQKTDAA